ncbi:MAG: type II secretion system protein [Phycisphaeraceae bacterium]|nr:type II secretion system protein [Phycisphaeraceae bacterium]MBX3406846.1 type II secretion system protein [Phycisphaeraceae bacterium]
MNRTPQRTRSRRAFTLIEASVTIIIIAMLAGILMFAVRKGVQGARLAAERQLLNALSMGVQSFRNDHGFLPPLIDDRLDGAGNPVGNVLDGQNRPRVRDSDFLMSAGTSDPNDPRYSVYALQWYVMGMLDMPVAGRPLDGAAGPGITKPQPDGTFAGRGKVYDAKFDVGRIGSRNKINIGADEARISLTDRWGSNIRYYRWKPQYGADGQVAQYLVPRAVGDHRSNADVRSAEYAIVSLGPDLRTDERRPLPTAGNVTAAVDPAALDESVRDDLVETGR